MILLRRRSIRNTGCLAGLMVALAVPVVSQATPQGGSPAELDARGVPSSYRLPLSFEENRGQTDSRVQFLARARDYTVFLTPTEVIPGYPSQPDPGTPSASDETRSNPGRSSITMRLVGANPSPLIEGTDGLPGMSSYFRGGDRARWHTGIRRFGRVRYRAVYPGIDLIFYGKDGKLLRGWGPGEMKLQE